MRIPLQEKFVCNFMSVEQYANRCRLTWSGQRTFTNHERHFLSEWEIGTELHHHLLKSSKVTDWLRRLVSNDFIAWLHRQEQSIRDPLIANERDELQIHSFSVNASLCWPSHLHVAEVWLTSEVESFVPEQ